ncbi:MAG: OmpH family outer membrane protein [Candidatus Margulisbacteria bacterium]|jgi:outer membrane protein|nr:OmpH family outer membrane protein [Candidatus Margulisiibacteriota bacterium]
MLEFKKGANFLKERMNMKFAKIVLSALILLSFSLAATVGFIDVEQVFKGYTKTKTAQEEINNKMKDYKKALAKYQQELDDAKIDGKSEKEQDKIREKMQKELDPKEAEIKMLNEEQMVKIRKDIVTAVEAVAKEVGIDVVVDKQVVIAGGLDLTDSVVNRLNKKK